MFCFPTSREQHHQQQRHHCHHYSERQQLQQHPQQQRPQCTEAEVLQQKEQQDMADGHRRTRLQRRVLLAWCHAVDRSNAVLERALHMWTASAQASAFSRWRRAAAQQIDLYERMGASANLRTRHHSFQVGGQTAS